MKLRPWLLAICLLLPACRQSPVRHATTTRDSAGVRIVESHAPRWLEAGGWQVDPEPILDLTRRNGRDYEFFRVEHAVRFGDGRIAVANRGSSDVRLFSPSGEFLRSFGREGEGPGEFLRLTSVHAATGDSVLAFDYWQRRITLFSLDGSGSRTVGLPQIGATVWRIAPLRNGQIIGSSYNFDTVTGAGLYRLPYAIFRLDLAELRADTIAQIPGPQGFMYEQGDARPLFPRDGHFAVYGDRVYLGDGDSLRIDVRDSAGRLERIIRVPGYDLWLTAADLSAERDAMTPPSMPAELREVVARLPDPETRPAYSGLLVDADGNIWAPEYHARTEVERPLLCTVFSPEGEWLGNVQLPARFTPYQIGSDYVLGLRRDDADVERVQLLRLTRTPWRGRR